MNADPPPLTDRARLALNRARASALGLEDVLHRRVIADVEERLIEVNRSFTAPAIVSAVPELWAASFPTAAMACDDPTLTLRDGAHDLVIHAMALHWANDPVGQLIQCRRALRPDGLFLGVCPGGRTLHELRAVLAEVEARLRGGLSPRIAPMAEIRDLGGLMQRAGFAMPVCDSTSLTLTYPGLTALLRDLRAMGEGNAMAARDPRPLPRAAFAAAEALYRQSFATRDGRLPVTVEIVTLTGWAPSPDQPRALRPGSAVARLADALGAAGTPGGDPAAPGPPRPRGD